MDSFQKIGVIHSLRGFEVGGSQFSPSAHLPFSRRVSEGVNARVDGTAPPLSRKSISLPSEKMSRSSQSLAHDEFDPFRPLLSSRNDQASSAEAKLSA